MFDLSKKLDTMLLAKVTFAFDPSIVMSPMCLPRSLLNNFIDNLLKVCKDGNWKQQPLIDVLENIKNRPTFEEEWPAEYKDALSRGKSNLLKIERIRNDKFTMENILKDEILAWWRTI